jgi:hypothetical protein
MIFFIMVMVILVFVVLWNFDLHKILHVKNVTQNAGDSAALVAARWQGLTLNLIGDLNIMHAAALTAGDAETVSAITNIQARLCYVGPMIAFEASQQAAKNNGIFVNESFTQFLDGHADDVRNDYPTETGPDGEMLFPEPYPNCWEEYADMLQLIADEGVAAGPDNAHFYGDYTGGHVLLTPGFYDAVAGESWCWFYNYEPTLLEDYEDFFPCWWPALPVIPRQHYMNSEIFGLGLTKQETTLAALTDYDTISDIATDRAIGDHISPDIMMSNSVWYCYSSYNWSSWSAMDEPFPVTGEVKPEYDYTGADAAVRIEADSTRLTPGAGGSEITDTIVWTAAAKPFGYLNKEDRPDAYRLVLPAFRSVRLIPVDASSAPAGGGYNLSWREHIEEHLPVYMEGGPKEVSSSCRYCRQLKTWESSSFRKRGVDWLEEYSYKCIAVGGGSQHGGGTQRGH